MDKAELKRPSNFKSHIQFKKDGELPVSDYNQQESAFSWPMHLLLICRQDPDLPMSGRRMQIRVPVSEIGKITRKSTRYYGYLHRRNNRFFLEITGTLMTTVIFFILLTIVTNFRSGFFSRRSAGSTLRACAEHARVCAETPPRLQAERGQREGHPGRLYVGFGTDRGPPTASAIRRRQRSYQSVDAAT